MLNSYGHVISSEVAEYRMILYSKAVQKLSQSNTNNRKVIQKLWLKWNMFI